LPSVELAFIALSKPALPFWEAVAINLRGSWRNRLCKRSSYSMHQFTHKKLPVSSQSQHTLRAAWQGSQQKDFQIVRSLGGQANANSLVCVRLLIGDGQRYGFPLTASLWAFGARCSPLEKSSRAPFFSRLLGSDPHAGILAPNLIRYS